MLIKKYTNSSILVIPLLFILCGTSYPQWQRTNLPDTVKVNTLAIRDSNIFAGTDGNGIFLSSDNGESWVSINDGLQSQVIHTIFINGTTIFAGTETGASVSTNNGLYWETINSGLPGSGVWSFAVSNILPGDSTIFAGTWNGVYASANNGKNWETTGLNNTTMPVHSIIVNGNFIFAATLGGGVFNSQNNGFIWKNINIIGKDESTGITTLIPVYSLAIINDKVIAGAGAGIFYITLYYDTIFNPVSSYPKRNQPILSFARHNATLFAGNLIGDIFISGNDGSMWNHLFPSLRDQAIYSLVLNNSYIFAGTGSGVWRLRYPGTSTSINDHDEIPTRFALEQNYPNPFNPSTKIKYSIPLSHPSFMGKSEAGEFVSLKVYDILGNEVATLVNEEKSSGNYEVEFSPDHLSSGIYVYRLKAGPLVQSKKLVLLK